MLFGYRWLAAKTQRFQKSFRVLGIDMSRAFDNIRRDKLLTVLEIFVNESELRIIRMLLADTTLKPRLKRGKGPTFCNNHSRPVKLWFDPKQIATETISPVLIQEIFPEHHIKNII